MAVTRRTQRSLNYVIVQYYACAHEHMSNNVNVLKQGHLSFSFASIEVNTSANNCTHMLRCGGGVKYCVISGQKYWRILNLAV